MGAVRRTILEASRTVFYPEEMTQRSPFRYFKTSPEIIRLAVMMHIRFPLSLRNVEDLLHERGIGICHETVRFWWHRFGPMFAAEIRKRRVSGMRWSHWQWHLDEVFVKINGERHYLWKAVDHDGEVLAGAVMKTRDKRGARTALGHAGTKRRLASLCACINLPERRQHRLPLLNARANVGYHD